MPGQKKRKTLTAAQIEERRSRVARLYLQCFTTREIAKEIGISQSQVSRDLVAIREEWRGSAVRDFEAYREREIRKCDVLEREYWESFRRSREDQREETSDGAESTVTSKGSGDGGANAAGGVTETRNSERAKVKVKYNRPGDIGCLAGILKAQERRAKLMGLDAPERIAQTDTDGNDIAHNKTEEALFDAVEQLLSDRLRTVGSEAVPGSSTPGESTRSGKS